MPKPVPQTGNGSASSFKPKAVVGTVICYTATHGSPTRTILTARMCSAGNSSAGRSTEFLSKLQKVKGQMSQSGIYTHDLIAGRNGRQITQRTDSGLVRGSQYQNPPASRHQAGPA